MILAKRAWSTLPLLLALSSVASGCVATAVPRFPPDVAAAIRREPMRRMESPELIVYYPADRRAEAERFQGWVGGCLRNLNARRLIDSPMSRRKPFVVLVGTALNNAFVMPPIAGMEPASVVTGYSTFDALLSIGSAPDPALFGCHEMVHWVQFMQIAGFWGAIDSAFGDILSPHLGLDPWFHEGLATYYETLLQTWVGRMSSPFWEGAFHAGVAGHRVNGGDLSFANRKFLFGNHYLVGSRFIAFLATRYGEAALWQLVEKQGRSFFFPFGVALRFRQVYGKTLPTLIDEFATDVSSRYPVVARAPDQRVLRRLGYAVEHAVSRNGTEVVVTSDFADPVRLEVRSADGRLLARRSLEEVLLPRKIVEVSPASVSGLSLTADGRAVFFAVDDLGVTFRRTRLFRYDVAGDRLQVVSDDLGGPGGAVTDDGSAFFFAKALGDRHQIGELDLRTGQSRIVAPAAAGIFYGSPRPSPDGRRLVATVVERNMARVVVLDRASGRPLAAPLVMPGPSVDPWFADDRRVLFASESGRRFQIFSHDTTTGTTERITRAPYVALGGRPGPGNRLRFLNREGWGWTLDETALPALAAVQAPLPAPSADPRTETPPSPPPSAPAGWTLPPPHILSDGPYRAWERLFSPQLRGVSFTAMPDSAQVLFGLALGGGDRLSLHRWALAGYFQPANQGTRWSGSVGYANSQLAPLGIRLVASDFNWWSRLEVPGDDLYIDRGERELLLELSLPFFTHALAMSAHATELRQGDPLPPPAPPVGPALVGGRHALGGATAELQLVGVEATPFTGARRLLALELTSSIFPESLGTESFTFADLRAALSTRLPVPPSRLLGLGIALRGRTMPGALRGAGLLELGGDGSFAGVYEHSSVDLPPVTVGDDVLERRALRFREPLRGYEDVTVLLERVVIADVRLNYPFIIDRGFASSLLLLPSFFIRQVELEAFGAFAWDTRSTSARESWHNAAGGAFTLRTAFGPAPLSIRYQLSRRLTDDRAWLHFVGIGN